MKTVVNRYHRSRSDRAVEARRFAVLFLLGGALMMATLPHPIESFPLSRNIAFVSKPGARRGPTTGRDTSNTVLSAHFSLTTALESLWEKRVVEHLWKKQMESDVVGDDEADDYRCLSWLDLEDSNSNGSNDSEEQVDRGDDCQESDEANNVASLPLYPINDVYLPSAVNHTLYNVEPQNIQMALNLLSEQKQDSARFCVVLRARDTGRIASVANVLRIVDSDVQRIPSAIGSTGEEKDNDDDDDDDDNDGDETNGKGDDDEDEDEDSSNIMRIRLTCRSEGLVGIQRIENGSGWAEKRVLRSKEYLRATVRHLPKENADDSDWRDAYNTIREDLRTIKLIYQLQLGGEEFPPDTLLRLGSAMRDFPELDSDDSTSSSGDDLLWEMAQEWQSVCMTLRQGTEAWLSADRNEKLVAAARAKGGGILKLPIHLSELNPEDRKDIQKLDQEAQEKHKAFGMDPVLDFQVLLGLPTTTRRFGFLARLVNRERRRLEDIASSYSSWS